MSRDAELRPPLDLPQLAPDTEVGGYRVRRLIGAGAMGHVYLAQDIALGRWAALKFVQPELLDAESAARIVEEGRTTAQFNHPHIVTVYAAGTFRGQPYLALEYVEGGTLRDRLDEHPRRLPVSEALRIARAIAEALSEAHRHGIVHADLKPENVLLPLDGRVRVVDFGLARLVGAAHGAPSGTPAYMAPERWRGVAPTPAIDVWALGVLLFEAVHGERPFRDAELARLAYATDARPRPGPELPAFVAEVIRSALSLDPAQRPSAEEIARMLAPGLEPARTVPGERSPFRGLRAFTEQDANDFFGREAELDAFMERLRREPLLVVAGPSGVGKTSFVAAGVIPRVHALAPWTVIELRPGGSPVARLEAVLQSALSRHGLTAPLQLADRPGDLVGALRLLVERGRESVLLVLDAFEEVFTLASPEEALRFARVLAAAAGADDRWRILLTIRDDYLAPFARIEALRAHVPGLVVLGPLGEAGLQEAITGPLRRVGYRVDDPALPSRIVADLRAQPAGLPLLQFACAALWERRDPEARLVLSSVYDQIGGVGGALATHAAQFVRRLLPAEVPVARSLLLRMLTPEGTRRPRPQQALLDELGPAASRLLDTLVGHRLVVATRDPASDETWFELSHESLATTWPDLARWREESREEHVLVHEIGQASELWERRGRRDDETWTGDALQQTLRRVAEWKVGLPSRSRAFLDAGRRRTERRARTRRLAFAVTVSALVAIALGAVITAINFREKQLEALRQQTEIRLAAADIGQFDLVLQPWDFDPTERRWAPARFAGPPRWTLAPAAGSGASSAPAAYGAPELTRYEGALDPDGAWRERVEAPSREAWLTVERDGCPPSRVQLRRLPGFTARGQPMEVRVPVPTCQASRAGLVRVPAGVYWRPGKDRGDPDMLVDVPGFAIDRNETSNARFSLFEGSVLPLSGDERSWPPELAVFAAGRSPSGPVTGVDAFTAEAYCHFLGQELPTLDEWRKAFRGGVTLDREGAVANPAPRRLYPWAGDPSPAAANLARPDGYAMAPVGAFPRDASPYGVLDLAGNVSEWTASVSTHADFRNLRLVAGGRWDVRPEAGQHEVHWVNHLPARRFDFAVGLRCVERDR